MFGVTPVAVREGFGSPTSTEDFLIPDLFDVAGVHHFAGVLFNVQVDLAPLANFGFGSSGTFSFSSEVSHGVVGGTGYDGDQRGQSEKV